MWACVFSFKAIVQATRKAGRAYARGGLRFTVGLGSVWLALFVHAAPPAQAGPNLQVIDDQGATLTLAQTPARVVSLLPSLTETVCALAQCSRLVAVDAHSNAPEAVKKLPKTGTGLAPNIEAIVALQPDLVLLAASSPAVPRLRSLGLPVLALEPKTHADVWRVMQILAQVLRVPLSDAHGVWQGIDAALSAAARTLPPQAKSLRVYFEVGSEPYAAGPASFMGQTLARLGVQNIVPPGLGPFPKLNPEWIVRANPDVIMVSALDAPGLYSRPGWQRIRALQHKHVCVYAPAEMDVLVRPGPRMAQAARIMADCLTRVSP